uniref:VGF nerve growth factor inducible n=1 Tax=Oryzias sinensis TaxID=183150 RepID=A0A8C7Z358_9TELE
ALTVNEKWTECLLSFLLQIWLSSALLTMTENYKATSVFTLLILLVSVSFPQLSTSKPLRLNGDGENLHADAPSGLEHRHEESASIHKEEEEELFKDVDPRKLAAVLLEALNHSQAERGRPEEEEVKTERRAVKKEEANKEGADRNRDGREELEMLIASHGKDRGIEEEEERKRAKEEEERMTEQVNSHTVSQTIQFQKPTGSETASGIGNGAASPPGLTTGDQNNDEDDEEEQLNPEELKSLETMMKEFPRLNTVTEREVEAERRQTRAFSSYNDVIPKHKGSDLALTKKKLKWQEETQKALYFPKFDSDNSIQQLEDKTYGGMAAQAPPTEEQEEKDDEPEEEEEEVLSPEEEEARAKVEQEEMLRQAAEAQKAKMEEEKLADIASDMLLRYMVKQNHGKKKHSSPVSNAAEDKRSNEEQEVTEENDIDPQTIDKLIEISSKLHLPADDVVDIITDVEKKKKKDAPQQLMSFWQRPPSTPSSSLLAGWQASNQNSLPVSKQPSPAANLLKTWFQEKNKLRSEKFQKKLSKSLQASPGFWSKPAKLHLVKQNRRLNPSKSAWTNYPAYPYAYTSYYQRSPFLDYYPIYLPPAPRPKPLYYISKPPAALNSRWGGSVDAFPPRRHYQSWVQPQLRRPPPVRFQHMSYYNGYPPRFPQPLQRVRVPEERPSLQTGLVSSLQKMFDNSVKVPTVTRNDEAGRKADGSSLDDLETYIQQILMERPHQKE